MYARRSQIIRNMALISNSMRTSFRLCEMVFVMYTSNASVPHMVLRTTIRSDCNIFNISIAIPPDVIKTFLVTRSGNDMQ